MVCFCFVLTSRKQDVHAPRFSKHWSSLDETRSVVQQTQAHQQQGQHQQPGAGKTPLTQSGGVPALLVFDLGAFVVTLPILARVSSSDDRSSVAPQVPASSAHRGGEGGKLRRSLPSIQSSDLHLPRDAVHRCHCLPERRCKSL